MIVFYHIPKTAGVSLTRAAADAIPGPHRRVLLTQMRQWLACLEAGSCDVGPLAFLAGHFGYGVHRHLPAVSQTLTFLRNPIDQTVSMHSEAMKRPDIYPHGDLRTLLSGRSGQPYFGNAQVRHLASEDGRPVTGPLSAFHLARAKHVVTNELTCFGLTEYFAASLALINECLGTRLTAREANVSSRVSVRDLDPDLLLLIWDANGLDRELYEYGRTVFLGRLRSLAGRHRAPAELAV
jgi:hypothetical protein